MALSGNERPAVLERLGRQIFDLVIVGGGINGAAAARAAVLRGYSAALVEQDDIGSGTSSRSSRLIHGGLRYLEQMELGLVFESVSERALLARAARHIVRPLQFVFPVYRGDRVGLGTVRLGMWLYDALALFRNYERHRKLAPEEVSQVVPGIREAALRGALGYYDYRTDDGRLVLENAIAAARGGAAVASYARVEGLEAGRRIKVVNVRDRLSGETLAVRGRTVLCAAGPWTDRVLGNSARHQRWLRPTKGVHIVVPHERLPVKSAVVMQHPADARVVFLLPFYERTVVGTTDTDFEGDPADANTTVGDVDYLLEAVAQYFPSAHLGRGDVFATWAGVRPLVQADTDDPSAVSREERIETLPGGVVVVAGGKLTTYRRIASACLDAAADVIAEAGGPPRRHEVEGERAPLPGGEGLETEARLEELGGRLSSRLNDPEVAAQLCHAYGSRAPQVLELVDERPELAGRMLPDLPLVWAQVVFAAREELALSLADVMVRRTQLTYRALDQGRGVAVRVAKLMGDELSWSEAKRKEELASYDRLLSLSFRNE